MKKIILSLLLIVTLNSSLAIEVPEPVVRKKWNQFKTKYNRRYGAPENSSRYQTFKKNLNKIEELNDQNKKVNGDAPFDVTAFSDLSDEEFSRTFLSYHRKGALAEANHLHILAPVPEPPTTIIPPNFSWTEQKATTEIKDQGQCGACWSFAVVEQLESAIFLKDGVLPVLSTQQVTSCSLENSGCQGGDPLAAYNYLRDAGIQLEDTYPYSSTTGATGSCTYDKSKAVAFISGFRFAVPSCAGKPDCQGQMSFEQDLQRQIMKNGPATVCLDASSWQNYSGGIMAMTACSSTWDTMDHCLQLVGWKTPDSGPPYWVLRNQWGVGFGKKGFIYLQMGTNTCGVLNQATFVNDPTYYPTGVPLPSPSVAPSPLPSPKPCPLPYVSPHPGPNHGM